MLYIYLLLKLFWQIFPLKELFLSDVREMDMLPFESVVSWNKNPKHQKLSTCNPHRHLYTIFQLRISVQPSIDALKKHSLINSYVQWTFLTKSFPWLIFDKNILFYFITIDQKWSQHPQMNLYYGFWSVTYYTEEHAFPKSTPYIINFNQLLFCRKYSHFLVISTFMILCRNLLVLKYKLIFLSWIGNFGLFCSLLGIYWREGTSSKSVIIWLLHVSIIWAE